MSGWFDSFNQAVGLTEDPAEMQKQAADNALTEQQRVYNQQREDFAPYREMGAKAVTDYQNYIKNNPYSFTYKADSPAYTQQKNELDRSMERRLAATGRSNSTYANDSLSRAYANLAAQDYTNQENTSYGRWLDAYNRLLDPIKIGQGMAAAAGNNAQGMSAAYAAHAANVSNAAQQGYANRQGSLYGNIGMGLSAYNTFRPKDGGGGMYSYNNGSTAWEPASGTWEGSGYGQGESNFVGPYQQQEG